MDREGNWMKKRDDLVGLEYELEARIRQAVEPYRGMPIALSGGIDSSTLAAFIKPRFAISVELPTSREQYNEIQYAKLVANYLGLDHKIVRIDESKFDESMEVAVKAIGRPIPHFNIFPLNEMYRELHKAKVKDFVLGDGPDETMAGYARDLIVAYLYDIYKYEAFKNYHPMIKKVLDDPVEVIAKMTGKDEELIRSLDGKVEPLELSSMVNVVLMRRDMDDMSNSIATYHGVTNHRPYQDDVRLDNFMRGLPREAKIHNVEYGKYLLRRIAARYLPKEIAWRKAKVGGPLYSVNRLKGWYSVDGEYGKSQYLKYQEGILNG
jgi:asparagine synthetase B (glutamine-hydrolysing)